ADVPAPGDLTANDNCAGDITVTGSDSTDSSDPCNIIITRTWTFTDACNNSSSVSQTITVGDTIAPVAPSAPADITYECIADVPAPGDLTANDNCTGDITVTGSDSTDSSDPCNIIITRTWTFTDACNNSSSVSQTITVADTIAPVAPSAPADTSYECIADVPAPGDLTANDNCAGDITVTGSDSTDSSDPCNIIITRTWTFTDACNNSSSVSQTITVADTIAPVAPSAPADITYECIADVPAPGDLTATDNCSGDIVATAVDSTNDTDPCNIIITRTWTFTDACDNSSSVSQTITVTDTIAPVAPSAPADITYECIADVPAPGDLTANDNCAGDITVTGVDNTDSTDPCNIIITRTWTFTDACDNSSSVSQIINVIDTIPPQATNDLSDLSVVCSEIPEPPTLVFDECSGDVTIVDFVVTSTSDGSDSDYEIIWTWSVIDNCGNKDMIEQYVFVTNENFVTEISDSRCSEDGIIDLFDYYSGTDDSGTWVVESGDTTLDGNYFDPLDVELGDYIFSYSVMENGCLSTTQVTITVNDDCIVLPCGLEDVVISTAVTPNGDQYNEYFEITGIEECGFVIDIKVFNRWGAMIFETDNYQNNWNGSAHKSSVGGADTVPTGTYYYIVNLKNSGLKPITGYFYVGTK
ncbi:gliding motility-associated C-terminal domain-containing protein, partial [Hanstruepera marina]|uniref:gliding motility-associated C-terminal domain-containing protein n=1 Tax=Hanstruepera marina TaxID=2873265 RepID=UPI001CA726D3